MKCWTCHDMGYTDDWGDDPCGRCDQGRRYRAAEGRARLKELEREEAALKATTTTHGEPDMDTDQTPDHSDITKRLAEPFDASEIKWKPGVVSGNRALALAYVDARVIQDRLDEVVGPAGWQDDYEILPEGSVVCRLKIKIGGEWVTKVDVGSTSEQPDVGDRMKAAFSDALKRAAVKFGLGRFLYRLPAQWVAYDPQRRQFLQTPLLSAAVVCKAEPTPQKKTAVKPAEATAPKADQAKLIADTQKKIDGIKAEPDCLKAKVWIDKTFQGDVRDKLVERLKARVGFLLMAAAQDAPAPDVLDQIEAAVKVWQLPADAARDVKTAVQLRRGAMTGVPA